VRNVSAKVTAVPAPAPARGSFLSDVTELRKRARREIEDGAVTPGYKGDLDAILRILNVALATEIVCVLRYKRHYFMADGIHADPVKEEFLEHANEEQAHADAIAERICQLGGEPDLDPSRLLGKSHTEYQEGDSLAEMIREDLVAERIAIESYKEMIAFVGENDSTTRRLFEWILGQEEEHANDLADLLKSFDGEKVRKS
jgi:bacterioferritin